MGKYYFTKVVAPLVGFLMATGKSESFSFNLSIRASDEGISSWLIPWFGDVRGVRST